MMQNNSIKINLGKVFIEDLQGNVLSAEDYVKSMNEPNKLTEDPVKKSTIDNQKEVDHVRTNKD